MSCCSDGTLNQSDTTIAVISLRNPKLEEIQLKVQVSLDARMHGPTVHAMFVDKQKVVKRLNILYIIRIRQNTTLEFYFFTQKTHILKIEELSQESA
jgi:hypothetical protein